MMYYYSSEKYNVEDEILSRKRFFNMLRCAALEEFDYREPRVRQMVQSVEKNYAYLDELSPAYKRQRNGYRHVEIAAHVFGMLDKNFDALKQLLSGWRKQNDKTDWYELCRACDARSSYLRRSLKTDILCFEPKVTTGNVVLFPENK